MSFAHRPPRAPAPVRAGLLVPLLWTAASLFAPGRLQGQEPQGWGSGDPLFHTFSIVAVDPETGESGVAVTTRVACVGNAVPWVRAGVGAVATQSWTRVEYGPELLDMLEHGVTPAEALARAVAADTAAPRRQVGVVALDGTSAQHTGGAAIPWAGHRAGPDFAVQGNLLEGPEVVDAVAETFAASAGSGRHLADRLVEALEAGQARGGDARKGRLQSAAVVVADPREDRARRPDGVTVHINVCENPAPVAELRRIWNTISGTLGYRPLQETAGSDVVQLKIILHALGYYRPEAEAIQPDREARVYDAEAVAAMERFRADQGLSTARLGSPRGLVDARTVALLWRELEAAGEAVRVRRLVRDLTAVTR